MLQVYQRTHTKEHIPKNTYQKQKSPDKKTFEAIEVNKTLESAYTYVEFEDYSDFETQVPQNKESVEEHDSDDMEQPTIDVEFSDKDDFKTQIEKNSDNLQENGEFSYGKMD
ncbi:hypothetical protein BB558_003175 [Smittium angustum]|uniref:Uncharacterized protein n=1 Tax=Smittium angustum TaxID=133377 RepID=A0A2U1J6T3_SMIAN|nr:hypothetical protein BB558_003175 [Smittium angustum]